MDASEQMWCLSDGSLRAMLRKAHAGEDPDLVFMEAYVNSFTEPLVPEDAA